MIYWIMQKILQISLLYYSLKCLICVWSNVIIDVWRYRGGESPSWAFLFHRGTFRSLTYSTWCNHTDCIRLVIIPTVKSTANDCLVPTANRLQRTHVVGLQFLTFHFLFWEARHHHHQTCCCQTSNILQFCQRKVGAIALPALPWIPINNQRFCDIVWIIFQTKVDLFLLTY